MIQIDELKQNIKDLTFKLNGVGESLNLPKLEQELAELNAEQHKADFWNDVKNAQQVSQRAKNIEDKIALYGRLRKSLSDVTDLLELCDGDESMLAETASELSRITADVNALQRSFRVSTTPTTLSLLCTRARAERKRRTGCRCCTVCTPVTANGAATSSKCWIFSTAKKQASSPLLSK